MRAFRAVSVLSIALQRAISVPALAFALLTGAAACGGSDGPGGTAAPVPASLSVSAPAITLTTIDGTSTVTATVRAASGEAISGASIAWSSDAPGIAAVSGSGGTATVTATGRGVTVIHARSGAFTGSVTVLVRTAFNVAVTPGNAMVRVGNTASFSATVSADDGASSAVTWSSNTPTVATINAQGVVTGVAPGTAAVTARSVSDYRLTATASVTVTPARGVIVSPSEMSVGKSESRALTAQVFVNQGESTDIIWRTNHPLLASVNASGVVTGITDGNATILAISAADTTLRASAIVRVLPVVRSITVSPSVAALNIGQTQSFSAAVVFDQGASNAITWSSSNAAVATVSAQGVTTAVGIGSAEIRARSVADTTRLSVAQLTVAPRPVQLVLGAQTLGLTVGNSSPLSATVTGDPGISTAVNWTTRNTAVASVNGAGEVSAVGGGQTYVVATALADANRRDSVRVTVVNRLAISWTSARLGGPLIEDVISLWAPSQALAYAVNSIGDVYRWDGSAWSVAARGTQFGTSFMAVHGASASAITAVGSNGVVVRFNGTSWAAQSSSSTATLTDVWMHHADTAWAVGAGGAALRYVNGTWAATSSGTSSQLRGVWGSGALAFAVGDGGVVQRWQNNVWQTVASGTTEVLRDVWSASNVGSELYAVGDFGTIIRWNGSAFEADISGTTATLYAVVGGVNGALVAAGDGVALRRSGSAWSDQSPPYRTRFTSAAIDEFGAMWVGGQRGLVMRSATSGPWATLSLTPDLLDAWSTSASHAIAVGELGFIFRYNGADWVRQLAPTLERLNTVWAGSASSAFVGGDNGVLLHWDGATWAHHTSPTSDHIYAMWGANNNAVWAVTDGGDVLFWDGSDWEIVYSQAQPLYGVFGTAANDVHIVGLSGTALHWNGTAWTSRNAGVNHVLVGLWAADASQAVTVGARDFSSGVAMRYNGAWSETTAGTTRILSAVWGAVGFDLYAVGDLGTIVRYNGIGWQTMPSGSTDFLWAITGAPDAGGAGFAVGLNGTVIQAQSNAGSIAAIQSGGGRSNRTATLRSGPRPNLAPSRSAPPRSNAPMPSGASRTKRGR